MPPASSNGDLIIQTDDGAIYAIPAANLGNPVSGDAAGISQLQQALAPHAGKAIGLRAAVMGYSLPNPVGERMHIDSIANGLSGAGSGQS